MKLDRETMKKLRELILFTIIILIALANYGLIFEAIRFVFGIIFPFLLGGAIAFVLNVPMSFFEKLIFDQEAPWQGKSNYFEAVPKNWFFKCSE